MRTFLDNSVRTWTVSVTVDTVERVRSMTGVNLLAVEDGKLVDTLTDDAVLLCKVLYAVCNEQAQSLNVSEIDFLRAMAGEKIDSALKVLLDELVDFLPNRKRRILKPLLPKAQEYQEAALKRYETEIAQVDVEALLEKNSSSSAGDTQGSPASTPAL